MKTGDSLLKMPELYKRIYAFVCQSDQLVIVFLSETNIFLCLFCETLNIFKRGFFSEVNIFLWIFSGTSIFIAPFNNTRNLKFKSPPTVAFFAAVNHNLNICSSPINGP